MAPSLGPSLSLSIISSVWLGLAAAPPSKQDPSVVMIGSQLLLIPTGVLSRVEGLMVRYSGFHAYVLVCWESLSIALVLEEYLAIRTLPIIGTQYFLHVSVTQE